MSSVRRLTRVTPDESLERDVADFLASKRRRLTPASYESYRFTLDAFTRTFPASRLIDFELPVGTTLVEGFLSDRWAALAPRTFNKHLSILRSFFEWQVRHGRLHGDPTLPIERATPRQPRRQVIPESQCDLILAANPDPRDQIALRLLLHYGIRKGALQGIRFRDFDPERHRIEIFTKGQKIQHFRIPDERFWELVKQLVTGGARPEHYLLPRRRVASRAAEGRQRREQLDEQLAGLEEATEWIDRPDLVETLQAQLRDVKQTFWLATQPEVRVVSQDDTKPLGSHGLHHWWYRCLERAGIVDHNVTSGLGPHTSRHTAAQRILDRTGNLKAAQTQLGHASIGTTGDIYTEVGEEQQEQTMREVLAR